MLSSELYARSTIVAPGGVHSPVRAFGSVGGSPIFFRKAKGSTIESVEGNTYIDFCQSFGPLILGHRDSDVQRIVAEMVDTVWSLGTCEPYSLELAEWITKRIPWVEKVRFVNSGTEAVMSALRVARAVTGRQKILKFDGCYHGHLDALLVKAGSGLAGMSTSSSAGVSSDLVKETLVAPLDDEAALEAVFSEYGDQIAAVAIEPLPANYGLLPQRKVFLDKIFALAKKYQSLVLFDEVISGFRVALGGYAELAGYDPDLVCYGKVMGGGFPVGCYGGKAKYMRMVAPEGPVYQAGTLSANPIGMCAGLATLRKLEEENVIATLEDRSSRFVSEIQTIIQRHDLPLGVTREGSIFWLHVRDSNEPIRTIAKIPSNHSEWYIRFFHACLQQGLYFAPSGYEVSFLSLAHDEAILEKSIAAIDKALQASYGITA